jgi:hypothetical protein
MSYYDTNKVFNGWKLNDSHVGVEQIIDPYD